MNVTYPKLIQLAGLSAMLSGQLFVVIQPIHPLENAATVTSPVWATVAYSWRSLVGPRGRGDAAGCLPPARHRPVCRCTGGLALIWLG